MKLAGNLIACFRSSRNCQICSTLGIITLGSQTILAPTTYSASTGILIPRSVSSDHHRPVDRIARMPGFHVRLGSITGVGKKFRQKQVDVRLAVEALDHAIRKNMDSCHLITGDLDFLPLIESLIRFGTWVHLYYDPRSTPKELYTAADRSRPFSLQDYHKFSSSTFQQNYPIPTQVSGFIPQNGDVMMKQGHTKDGQETMFGRRGRECFVWIKARHIGLWYPNENILENYLQQMVCPVEWKS
jgi:NYN domain